MGWYEVVGRQLLLALPPEAAHRVAGGLLGLPLPWPRIGAASEDPILRVRMAGVQLRNPIGLAAGFDKSCSRLGALGELGFGYVVGGTITRAPRRGNPKPRIARSPAARSMVNAMGLPNPGARRAAANLAARSGPAPRFASVADEAFDDAVATVELLAPVADGIELNASCPNVSWGRDRDDEAHLRRLVTAFRQRTDRPVFVKLPPFVTAVEREAVLSLAATAQEAHAAGLTCSNSRAVADGRLAAGRGGLSGRALWEHTARIVAEVRAATGGELPIAACGGLWSARDVLACLEAGATTVQVYSALIYQGPRLLGALTRGLARELELRRANAPGLVGTANPVA
jgi:dihydroorotate dehydrogenase